MASKQTEDKPKLFRFKFSVFTIWFFNLLAFLAPTIALYNWYLAVFLTIASVGMINVAYIGELENK